MLCKYSHIIDSASNLYPQLEHVTDLQVVYVMTAIYEHDLRGCLETDEKTRKQLQQDVPRCQFTVDGVRCFSAPCLPTRISRFCTQSVFGMVVEILHRSFGVVAEHTNKRMHVSVFGTTSVEIEKYLEIFTQSADIPVRVFIYVNLHAPCVTITYLLNAE